MEVYKVVYERNRFIKVTFEGSCKRILDQPLSLEDLIENVKSKFPTLALLVTQTLRPMEIRIYWDGKIVESSEHL